MYDWLVVQAASIVYLADYFFVGRFTPSVCRPRQNSSHRQVTIGSLTHWPLAVLHVSVLALLSSQSASVAAVSSGMPSQSLSGILSHLGAVTSQSPCFNRCFITALSEPTSMICTLSGVAANRVYADPKVIFFGSLLMTGSPHRKQSFNRREKRFGEGRQTAKNLRSMPFFSVNYGGGQSGHGSAAITVNFVATLTPD